MSLEFRKTARHGSSYLLTQIASRLMGLVSFPIITRLLSVQEYGLLALANTTLLFLYALGKCGVPNALITRNAEQRSSMSGKLFWDAITAVSSTTLLVCSIFYLTVLTVDLFLVIPRFFYILPLIAFFRNLLAVQQAWLRAIEKISLHNIVSLLFEIGSTIVILLALFYAGPTLITFFGAKIFFECAVVAILLVVSFVSVQNQIVMLDLRSIKSLVSFGFPLVWLEVSMIIMTFGDRYQIGLMVDAKAVGLYSAAYNLAQYVQQMISQPLILAVYPLYNKLFAEKGADVTSDFLAKVLNYYFVVTIPLFIFISYHSHTILSVLASEKYGAAAAIVPVILVGNMLNGCMPIISAGLYVRKKTKIIGKATLICAAINLCLNWLFIKLWGYAGAAISTLLTFIILFIFIKLKSDQVLKININFLNCGKYILISLTSIAPSFLLDSRNYIMLLCSGVVFFGLYIILLLIFNKEILIELNHFISNKTNQ